MRSNSQYAGFKRKYFFNNYYIPLIKYVQVVEPDVLTYSLVVVDEPVVFRYSDPLAALNVGAPEPKKIPKLAVDESKIPSELDPPEGGATVVCVLI